MDLWVWSDHAPLHRLVRPLRQDIKEGFMSLGVTTMSNEDFDFEHDPEDIARERRKFLDLGFDMDRAQMLSESFSSPYKAYHLIKVKGCPLDLAFEILL